MTAPIRHDRAWYSVKETAELMSTTPEHVYRQIRAGQRSKPPADAISPEVVRKFGNKVLIHRSHVFGEVPSNVTAFPGFISDDQLDRALDRAYDRLIARLGHAVASLERTA